jgi:hypothetical protein
MEKNKTMFKRITAAALLALLATTSVFAAPTSKTPSKFVSVSVTSVSSTATLASAPASAPASVQIRNDGAVTIYADFDITAVAAASTTIPIAPCESAVVTFNANRIELIHPQTNQKLEINSELPEDFKIVF